MTFKKIKKVWTVSTGSAHSVSSSTYLYLGIYLFFYLSGKNYQYVEEAAVLECALQSCWSSSITPVFGVS